ncbi:MAG: TerB N-terminal domain-containing protein [Lachnospiraceae bacterium]|nr:TerB N-terminal domain-containing protein [Lachnospiraceae bacterium]
MRKAADWFYSTVFRDEVIQPRPQPSSEPVPPAIRAARSLENAPGKTWQSRESIFVKQAKLLVNYEDDYVFDDNVVRYFPTYQALTDRELRGYFSWRTKLRRGEVRKTSLSFAFLYIYELLNQIGVEDPLDGYRKLLDFQDAYGPLDGKILPYLTQWLADYVVYYGLDPNFLANSRQVIFDRSVTVLDNIYQQENSKVVWAVKQLHPKWLERSKFYPEHSDDFDAVIPRVLRRISDHCASRCKKTMVEQYFGTIQEYPVSLFLSAVFLDRRKTGSYEFAVDERCVYHCKNGFWTVRMHSGSSLPSEKLNDLMKTIDSVMRQEYAYRYPVKPELDTKWILRIIREEVQGLLAEKKAAEAKKIHIDYSQLAKIRQDAAATRYKLTVEEELEPDIPAEEASRGPEPSAAASAEAPSMDSPLSPAEYRLLQCLLYGGEVGWVRSEGYLLSVLVDGINEKLYDTFGDSVLLPDDQPQPVEDYIDDLKEMVRP